MNTVMKGTLFEERVRKLLSERHGFILFRVGARNDKGVDLRGYWNMKSLHPKIPSPSSSSTDTIETERNIPHMMKTKTLLHNTTHVNSNYRAFIIATNPVFF